MNAISKVTFTVATLAAISCVVTTIFVINQIALKIILGGVSLGSFGLGITLHCKKIISTTSPPCEPKTSSATNLSSLIPIEKQSTPCKKIIHPTPSPCEPKTSSTTNPSSSTPIDTQSTPCKKIIPPTPPPCEPKTSSITNLSSSTPLNKKLIIDTLYALVHRPQESIPKFPALLAQLSDADLRKFPPIYLHSFFMLYAKAGQHVSELKLLLARHPQLDERDVYNGNTPLLWAIANANNTIALEIIPHCSPQILNMQDNGRQNTALILALSKGYTTVSMLHEPLTVSNLQLARTLLEKGADPNIQDSKGNTALHIAAIRRDPEMINLLISCGANKNIINHEGKKAKDFLEMNFEQASKFLKEQVYAFLLNEDCFNNAQNLESLLRVLTK